MSDKGMVVASLSILGWELMVGTAITLWTFCRVDIGRAMRLAVIVIAFFGTVTMGSLYVTHAQDEPERRETVKDAQQDDHLKAIDKANVDSNERRIENRAENLAHRNWQDQQLSNLSDRIYDVKESIDHLYFGGTAVGAVITILSVLGFIRPRGGK